MTVPSNFLISFNLSL